VDLPGYVVFARAASPLSVPEVRPRQGLVDLQSTQGAVVREVMLYREEAGHRVLGFPAAVVLADGSGKAAGEPAPLVPSSASGSRQGLVRVNYLGTPQRVFPVVPVEAIEEGALTTEQKAQLKGSTLIVGSYGDLGERYRGPLGAGYAGVEIHAHAVAALYSDRPLRRLPERAHGWIGAGAALVAAALLATLGLGAGSVLMLSIAGGGVAAALQALLADWQLPVAVPVAGYLCGWISGVLALLPNRGQTAPPIPTTGTGNFG
jgi:CHASE2 domain-containing sensor protein